MSIKNKILFTKKCGDFLLSFFFWVAGNCTQGFMHVTKVLYHLDHNFSPKQCFAYIGYITLEIIFTLRRSYKNHIVSKFLY
jgi:hypothetical protein